MKHTLIAALTATLIAVPSIASAAECNRRFQGPDGTTIEMLDPVSVAIRDADGVESVLESSGTGTESAVSVVTYGTNAKGMPRHIFYYFEDDGTLNFDEARFVPVNCP